MMNFPEVLYLAGFVTAMITTLGAMPAWLWICRQASLVDDPGARKKQSQPVPLAGGPAIFTGLLISCAVGALFLSQHLFPSAVAERIAYGLNHRTTQLIVIGTASLAMLSLGLLDDRYELSAAIKFFGQLVVAFLVAAAGIRITLFVPSVVFSYFATILWIVTMVNAFNFMDNMNGLCGGLTTIAALFFGLSAALRGDYLVASLAFFFGGAFFGFLPYNFPNARAFLGDSGSHLAGFVVSLLAILPHYYSAKHPFGLAVLTPLFVLAVPLVDLVSVVFIRFRRGQPFYVGDNNHLSHRLVRRGLTTRQAVILIWAFALVAGAAGMLL
jgi:UDP-GlcNAc:undecaprenyl-phosphate GlcNAc-1-phosphate transferase